MLLSSWWLCTDVCTFEGKFTSSSLSVLASVRTDFHLEVAARVLDGWGAVSLHPEKAQWHSLHAALSAKVDIGQTAEGLQEAVACRAIGIFRGHSC